MRDLTRARDDMKSQERKARQQLNAFVLRHGHSWPSGKTRWGKPHYNWLEELRQQVVLQEYIDEGCHSTGWGRCPSGHWLRSQVLWLPFAVSKSAMVLLAELGDSVAATDPGLP